LSTSDRHSSNGTEIVELGREELLIIRKRAGDITTPRAITAATITTCFEPQAASTIRRTSCHGRMTVGAAANVAARASRTPQTAAHVRAEHQQLAVVVNRLLTPCRQPDAACPL
jgi:hypothetical protein